MVMEGLKQKKWLRMALYIVVLACISIGFAYLIEYLMAYFDISVEKFASAAYLLVFGATLVSNASILVPVVFHVSIIITAAKYFNPALIALVGSVGGALGEITGYYAGYFGKRIIHLEDTPGYERLVGWMEKYGPLGIFFVSVQPILPIDVAGLLAGASKLPLWKFLLPCWGGKFIKYLLLCYLGDAFLDVLWSLLPPLPL